MAAALHSGHLILSRYYLLIPLLLVLLDSIESFQQRTAGQLRLRLSSTSIWWTSFLFASDFDGRMKKTTITNPSLLLRSNLFSARGYCLANVPRLNVLTSSTNENSQVAVACRTWNPLWSLDQMKRPPPSLSPQPDWKLSKKVCSKRFLVMFFLWQEEILARLLRNFSSQRTYRSIKKTAG